MFDDLLGRVSIFGQAVCISRGTCGISTHAISYQVKAAMFVFAHVENHTGVAVALAASLRGWNLVRNCQVCASAATSASWPARLFFFGLGEHFRGVRGGPFSALRRPILDPGRSRKREPKWIPKLGPPKRKTCYSRANWGSILGPPSLASANPVTQHAGGDRQPAFL